MNSRGQIKLSDFGLSIVLAGSDQRASSLGEMGGVQISELGNLQSWAQGGGGAWA